jgi:hypothetical protein
VALSIDLPPLSNKLMLQWPIISMDVHPIGLCKEEDVDTQRKKSEGGVGWSHQLIDFD